MESNKSVLVFTIAFNGYQYLYADFLKSHRAYALRQGYEFLAISEPSFCLLCMECAWLKLSVLLRALQMGYETVLFVDADASIGANTPAVESCFRGDKFLYMAKGYSNRFNSGVIIARNNVQLIADLKMLIDEPCAEIPQEDQVGWGENGHLIHLARRCAYVEELDWRWNNNHRTEQADYIRHYSAGPMRALFKASRAGLIRWWICQLLVSGLMRFLPLPQANFSNRLAHFSSRLFQRYGLVASDNLLP